MSVEPASGDERRRWEARYAERESEVGHAPSEWVVRQCLALPHDALILDVAGGVGRHAAPLARSGRIVVVADFIFRAVQAARATHPSVLGVVADASALPIREASVGAVVGVNFLDRSIFPSLAGVLYHGGALVYETYTRHHLKLVEAGRAHGPRTAAFLLGDRELERLAAPLEIREYTEGLVSDAAGERHVARVVAIKV
ncbi:MAG TPA: methyltransferase domain-containing protein [Gemmatimonadaceae bacterium]|jgi:hypothetical protein|nr:methyltransferase domain-containing protein [Gemmatimonadaceae bacterium]